MSFQEVPIGAAFDVRNGATPASGEQTYWDGDIPWVGPADLGKLKTRFIEKGERSITPEGYASCGTQMVPASSIILSIRAPIGHMAIASQAMCFNQGCRGLVPRAMIRSDYAFWALCARKSQLEAAGQGTTFIELARDKLRAERIPLPTHETQKTIADFLDRETARIDQLIEKKQRLLDVTKTVHASETLRAMESGFDRLDYNSETNRVEFIGLRRDWKRMRVKQVVTHMTSGSRAWSDQIQDEGELFLQSGCIDALMGICTEGAPRIAPQRSAEANRTRIHGQDVLVCITGGRTGSVGFVSEIKETAYINQHICLLRPYSKKIIPMLLAQILFSEIGQLQFRMAQYGLKQGLGFSEVANVVIPCPPVKQQAAICHAIDAASGRLEIISERILLSIDRLREFRAAFITAAVTGQIDVTTWGRCGETDRRLDQIEEAMRA